MELKKLTYKDAGVDIETGEETVRSIASIVQSTNSPGVISGIGQFGGMFEIPIHDYEKPVLVSSMDGVGTKLKVAIMMARFDDALAEAQRLGYAETDPTADVDAFDAVYQITLRARLAFGVTVPGERMAAAVPGRPRRGGFWRRCVPERQHADTGTNVVGGTQLP